jgi:hypothetical protein
MATPALTDDPLQATKGQSTPRNAPQVIRVASVNETGLRGIHFQRFFFFPNNLVLDPLEVPPVMDGAMIV